jgi:hypothetical protein
MIKLSELPFDVIYPGMKVYSSITKRQGIVNRTQSYKHAIRKEDNGIQFKWDNELPGCYFWHFQCNFVCIVDSLDNKNG